MSDLLRARLGIAPGALFQDLEGEIVILFRDRYFSLSDVGARIWACIAARRTVEDVLPGLLDEYEIDEATLRKDVTGLLGNLIAERLIVEEA